MSKGFKYSIGAAITLVFSVGLSIIIYGTGFISFNLVNLLAWILGPLGIYTLIIAFTESTETVFYLVWGLIMIAIALASILYPLVNVLVIFGTLLIALAAISLFAYLRRT